MTSLTVVREDGAPLLRLLGSHPSMVALNDAIRRAAKLDAPVIVCGPTGSGKELVARAVHRLSAHRAGPFCPVNVAALPETLAESELFGAVRGAFTGAVGDRVGLIEAAQGGSLFLDEAGDLAPSMQAKLLRVLEYGEVRRVGATKTVPIEFRLLVAVKEEPGVLKKTGRWRDDLYYRLAAVILRVPALRDRRSDIPQLVEAFLVARRLPDITPDGLELLVAHDWPGNVRELQQTLIQAAFYASPHVMCSDHVRRALGTTSAPRCETLAAVRLTQVRDVVGACGGDTKRAAAILGVSRRQVYRLLKAPERSQVASSNRASNQ